MSLNISTFEDGLQSFGPAIPNHFDFTPLFEHYILSILPSVVLLLAIPPRLLWLRREHRKVSASLLHVNKLTLLALFTLLQGAILVLYAVDPIFSAPSTIASASLVFIDALGLCLLSHVEHLRSVRPSTIVNTYLFVTLLFDVVRTRTLWIASAPKPISIAFTITTIVRLMVAVAEAVEKRGILLHQYQWSSPEVTSGIYSRSFFWWLNELMGKGFNRTIQQKDLFPVEDGMASSKLKCDAELSWKRSNKARPYALVWSTLKATKIQLAVCVFPRLCVIGFRFAQPFLLSRTINFINSKQDANNIGWGLTGAFGLVFVGLAVSNGSYYHMTYRFITSVRGSLVGMIYAKTVDLSVTSLDESVAITLMSNDVENICQGFQNIHEPWAVSIEMGIATWLLQRQLGLSVLSPVVVAVISTACVVGISKHVRKAQKFWNEGIQTRVGVTSSVLGSMKAVKLLGFTERITEILQGLRVTELQLSGPYRRLFSVTVFFANSLRLLAPLATFTMFVLLTSSSERVLTTATAYTTLSLIVLLANPVGNLLRTIEMLNSGLACFGRIQAFLESDSRQRHVLPLDHIISNSEPATPKQQADYGGEIRLLDLNFNQQRQRDSAIMDVRHASFGWNVTGLPQVQDVTFSVVPHRFLFITGPVGCGKSTLLRGLMGETLSTKGFVYSGFQTMAFVDQTPWIQNISIRQNIIGQSNFEEDWYKEVTQACALNQDIAALPAGHETIAGSGGISFSGGQKQRLALARAIYAKKELIIIDDGFSGLDAETEECVFERVFSKHGLFRRLGTTVILATHAVHRLQYADNILALDSTGHIVEQGNLEKLRSANGYIGQLATKSRYEDTPRNNIDSNVFRPTQQPDHAVEITHANVEENDPFRPVGEFSTYKYYFASIGWARSFLSLIYVMVAGIAIKLTDLLLTYWTDAAAKNGASVNSYYLGMYGMLTGVGVLAFCAAVYHYFLFVVPGSAEELHSRLLNAVMGAPLHFFTSTDTGITTNRFSQDMSIVDTELPFALIDFLISLSQTIMGVILMCLSTGYFTLTMPLVGIVVWVIQKFYLRTSRQIRILDLEAKAPLYSHFIESLSGLVTIRAFGWSDKFTEHNLELLDNSQKPYYLLFCIQRWLSLVLDLMVSVLAVVLMVLVVKLRSSIGAGYVGLALLNVMSFSQNLAWNVKQWTQLETSIGAISRLKTFVENTPNENLVGENSTVPNSWPTHGAIEMRNVSASYKPPGNLTIRDINMSIKPGEKIAVCGRTGSGKSSLIMTLFRLLEITPESSITVDGIDISKIPREVSRSRFNAIPQDPFFIKGSVRLNASPENLHSDADIIAALHKVKLWPIVESKGGLDADIDAEFFSHGQRQLFCLGRAILRKSKVVVLDEVSSSIDVVTDNLIQSVIREEFDNATIIAIAHRLDTILDFDRVALLSEGRLVEFDSPQVLLGRPSAFRELYNS